MGGYDTPDPLTYQRQTLIDVLRERLAERQQKRDEAKAKQQEKNAAVVATINQAISDNPQFLVWLAVQLQSQWGTDPADADAFKRRIDGAYRTQREDPDTGEAHDPDADIKRLIRVFEKAVDDTVKVRVTDEVYRHL